MNKFLAAAHDPESLLARRARLKSESVDAARASEPRQEPTSGGAEPVLDADMLDLVTRFEQNFAELAPPRDEPQNGPLSDDLFPEFPDQPFDNAPVRNRPRALELARFEPQASREATRMAANARQTQLDDQVDIDEAFSILKEAETQGAAKAGQAADDARAASEMRAAAAERALPPTDVEPQARPEHRSSRAQPTPEVARTDWASRSHKPRSIAVAAGVLVLAVGLTIGYVAGRAPAGKSHSVIQTTEKGGMVLRLDPNLRQR
jgi:hypothetical protein